MPGQPREPRASRPVRDVVFVDGVRTPFGKAGKKGMYAETRADDMVIRCIRELVRRNPSLPPERVDEVAIAATTQTGDQGLTIGRTAALLAGLPKTVPGLRHRPDVRRRHDGSDHQRHRHRLRRLRRRDRRRRRAHGAPPDGRGRRPQPADHRGEAGRPVGARDGGDGREPARPLPAPHQGARRRVLGRQPGQARQGVRRRQVQPDLVPMATRSIEKGWGLATADEPPRPGTTVEDLADAEDAVPAARPHHGRQRRRAQRRCHRVPARGRGRRRGARAAGARCGSCSTRSSASSPR